MNSVTLAAGYKPSKGLMLSGDTLTLNFLMACSGGPSTVTFFLEFSEDATTWFAEVAEEDAGKGVVSMPKVIRTLTDNNSTAIADNAAFAVSCQFKRRMLMARVQMAVSAGACVVTSLTAPYGLIAQ